MTSPGMPVNGPQPFCLFKAGDMTFGIEALNVAEVVRGGAVTSVPLAHPEVKGLMNLRGQGLTVIGLNHRLGIGTKTPSRPAHLVLKMPGEPVSLMVDELGDVVEMDPERFQEPPSTVPSQVRRLIRGACPWGGGLVLALRLEEVLRLDNR